MNEGRFEIGARLAGETLAAGLRGVMPGVSWGQAKRMIVTRRVAVNGVLCLNDARRLGEGDVVEVYGESKPPVAGMAEVKLLHIDADIVVVDKPAGVATLRRDEEARFSEQRKELAPTVDELVGKMLPGKRAGGGLRRGGRKVAAPPPVYAVHRLDRDTSGLMVFALSPTARDRLIALFSKHEVRRAYRAVCLGVVGRPVTFDTQMVRDRGDGRGGGVGEATVESKRAITHVRPLEVIGGAYTVLECRLETGRTHQIRIHLAEAGHMICGEKMYTRPRAGAEAVVDRSGAPRQALHSAELELVHPVTGRELKFVSSWPVDLGRWIGRIRETGKGGE